MSRKTHVFLFCFADAVQRAPKSCHAAFLACMKVAFERDRHQTDTQTDRRTNKHQILGSPYTKGPKGQQTKGADSRNSTDSVLTARVTAFARLLLRNFSFLILVFSGILDYTRRARWPFRDLLCRVSTKISYVREVQHDYAIMM